MWHAEMSPRNSQKEPCIPSKSTSIEGTNGTSYRKRYYHGNNDGDDTGVFGFIITGLNFNYPK